MNYTAGTTGRPKGVRRPIPDIDPDLQGTMNGAFLMLFGIQPTDLMSVTAAVAVLSLAALIAAWIPARRASRVDPNRALRSH